MKQANAYKPEQGTAPYIAVEYFRANPDTELSSAKLAEMPRPVPGRPCCSSTPVTT